MVLDRGDNAIRPGPAAFAAVPPVAERRQGLGLSSRLAAAAVAAWALAIPVRAAEVAIVLTNTAKPYRQAEHGLQKKLGELGHTSRTVQLKALARTMGKQQAGMDAQAAKRPDAYVAVGTGAAVWLPKHLGREVKMAYCMVAGPAAATLADQGNIPGISTKVPIGDQFKLIAEALPKARTVGMLYASKSPKSMSIMQAARKALPAGWSIRAVAIDRHASVAEAIKALLDKPIDLIWTAPDRMVCKPATVRSLLLSAIRAGKPVFGFSVAFVRAGALLGTGIDPRVQGTQAAELIDKLLGEADPRESKTGGKVTAGVKASPASRPQPGVKPGGGAAAAAIRPRYQIAVNLIVARKLSLRLPESVIRRANHVFGRPDVKTGRSGG